ncbi:hypothetical protein [Niabella drilacis]|uniref:Serine/threonine-protein kinase HipA n=1 Tax=Niabella drilacis (strain DSM 25811 / CCM 8410 / CCUG 62505 / LMG 26954 / E90) TaxID=1285928 RepID=A0A1G6Z0D9_NIADE|nr:hypothetical protein [Niabella drilacis]SDD96068.1 serine/threonine-protein kinase HipA [Niabella drilacis]
MGALRFKTAPEGPFSDADNEIPTPPRSSIGELQHALDIPENNEDRQETKKWLNLLMAPGSSLGGARPKANIADEAREL